MKTDEQKDAAAKLQKYIAGSLAVMEEETELEDAFRFNFSVREEAGTDEPGEKTIELARKIAAEVLDLSRLIFLSSEFVDEWVCFTAFVRSYERKVKPSTKGITADNIQNAIRQNMPTLFRHRNLLSCTCHGATGSWLGVITFCFMSKSHFEKPCLDLKWSVTGNQREGYKLTVCWGRHVCSCDVNVEALTTTHVLRKLQRLLIHFHDPGDAVDWRFRVDGKIASVHAAFERDGSDEYAVADVELHNPYNGRTLQVRKGEALPAAARQIIIQAATII